jgi:hypothetical protein
MTQLKQAISALTSDPDAFDSMIGRLNDDLSSGIAEEATLISIIDEILSQVRFILCFLTSLYTLASIIFSRY